MGKAILIFLGLILAVLGIWLTIPNAFWQYLFYLRLPIVMGLLLILLPVAAKTFLSAMLKNLFVLRGQEQLIFVIVSAIWSAMAVILVTSIILQNAPARFDLPQWLIIPELWQYGLAIALSLPICITAFDLSQERLKLSKRIFGAILGGGLGFLLLVLVNLVRDWLNNNDFLKEKLITVLSFFAKQRTDGYITQSGELAKGHLAGIAFLVIGLLTYAAVGFFYRPKGKSGKPEAPTLLYVILIIALITPFFGGATFYFDYSRVLVFLLFLLFSALSYLFLGINHYFDLKQDSRQNKKNDPQLSDFESVLQKRLQHQTGEQTLVVVCASGGGIQAAGWTAQVLTGLHQVLGKSFTDAIGLISSVSGGSVGTMYYLDRIDELDSYPEDDTKLDPITDRSTRDALDAVGWGLAYPDLWRILGIVPDKMLDRGYAIETDWRGELKQKKTLATWREQVLNGEIPLPVFNATIVEDGRRFLITPMTFGESFEKKSVDFNTLYENYDIDIVTAARLSATFPYVSPISRNNKNLPGYHFADGGYFDNSGFVTALEWLDNLLVSQKHLNIKKVLLLQINAFPESPSSEKVEGQRGWFIATVGPLLAAFKVRDPILASRNFTEVELFRQRWKEQVDIRYFPIFFPSEKETKEAPQSGFYRDDKYQPPLSWNLTDKQKNALKQGWISKKSQGIIPEIQKLWQKEWGMS